MSELKIKEDVVLISDFESPGMDVIPKGTKARLCSINEKYDIATIDLGDSMPAVPIALLKPANPKSVATKDVSKNTPKQKLATRKNKGKLPMDLVPPDAIEALARVLEYGKTKYDERNWERGAMYSTPYASLMRHLLAFWSGQDRDEESGLLHTDHILMNAAMLVRYTQDAEQFDDRPRRDNGN